MPRFFSDSAAGNGRSVVLDEWASKKRLRDCGLSTPSGELVSAAEVRHAADRIGYPVVVKAVGAAFLHKSELGAVKLGLENAEDVDCAVKEISRSVRNSGGTVEKFIVEQMITGAVAELIIGIKRDQQFGPALVIGAGGTLVELMTDTASLLLPTDRADVSEALNSLAVSKLLAGYRGRPGGDINALINAILSIATFAEDNWNTLLELDVNPLMVLADGQGVLAADALISMTTQ